LVMISADQADEDMLMEVALEAGAEDVRRDGDAFEITCEPEVLTDLLTALEKAKVETRGTHIARIPNNTVELDADAGRKVLKLMEALDDHDDVQNVSANFNIPDDALAELAAED